MCNKSFKKRPLLISARCKRAVLSVQNNKIQVHGLSEGGTLPKDRHSKCIYRLCSSDEAELEEGIERKAE